MKFLIAPLLGMSMCSLFISQIHGQSSLATNSSPNSVHQAVTKALPILQSGARSFRERSEGRCIGCHHQGMILQTVVLARQRGFAIDGRSADDERERIYGFYARRQGLYRQALTDSNAWRQADSYGNFTIHVGYWLWGLVSEKVPADDVLRAAANYLATKQLEDGRWSFEDSARAPMQASDVTPTALAILVLTHYGDKQNPAAKDRIERAQSWLKRTTPESLDEHAFRLFGLAWSNADAAVLQNSVDELLELQDAAGGWSQQQNMPADAYATGLAMVALQQAGGIQSSHAAVQQGVKYLLEAQRPDGSWFVQTRAIPSNPYFESGFPYGKSQFISYAASCWATQALLLSVTAK